MELAIDKTKGPTGDVGMAALARVHLGRVRRALGKDEQARSALEAAATWASHPRDGEQAALGECLLAAMDIDQPDSGAEERPLASLGHARYNDDAHVEVFTLDALARIATRAGALATARNLCGRADRRMEAASRIIADPNRTDAHEVGRIA